MTATTNIEGMESKYETGIRCTNCGFVGMARLEKGTVVGRSECPNCDCTNVLLRVLT